MQIKQLQDQQKGRESKQQQLELLQVEQKKKDAERARLMLLGIRLQLGSGK